MSFRGQSPYLFSLGPGLRCSAPLLEVAESLSTFGVSAPVLPRGACLFSFQGAGKKTGGGWQTVAALLLGVSLEGANAMPPPEKPWPMLPGCVGYDSSEEVLKEGPKGENQD